MELNVTNRSRAYPREVFAEQTLRSQKIESNRATKKWNQRETIGKTATEVGKTEKLFQERSCKVFDLFSIRF